MKVLIIGASGLVGGSLYKEFSKSHQVTGTYNHFPLPNLLKFDITNKQEAEKIIKQEKPEVVLNPAAYADVDGCEKNPSLCRLINVKGVKNVVNLCLKNKILFVFFSTDYIFDGRNGPYKEEDKPNPLNVYGRVKLEMENYIKDLLPEYLIIRTANVFGWETQGKNFVIRTVKNLKEGKVMNIVNDQTGSPTYVASLTASVLYLVENNHRGVYNVSGNKTINRYEFALEIAEVFSLDKNLIKPITTDKIKQAAKRPMKAGLDPSKVQALLPFKLLSPREGLEKMLSEAL